MTSDSEIKSEVEQSGFVHSGGFDPVASGRILIEVLNLINQETATPVLLRDVVSVLASMTGFEAVGLRLREGDDYPYFQTRGLSDEFIRLENTLCPRQHAGLDEIQEGDILLECACGAVIQGKIDRSKSFFTQYGSFSTNSVTRILNLNPELRRNIRGNCVQAGYESSALIPLRLGNQTFGLLQFEDKRSGMLSEELLSTLESVAVSLALALSQRQHIEQLLREKESLETLVQERNRELSDSNELLRLEIKRKEKVEAKLRESEARFRVLFDNSPDGVLVVDPEGGHILMGNRMMGRMLGQCLDDLPKLGLADIHPESAMSHVTAEFDSLMRGEKHSIPAIRMLRKDGSIFFGRHQRRLY